MNIGEIIKARRNELGMSAETLAQAIGVSPSTIYRYENNDISNMGIDKAKSLSCFLGINPVIFVEHNSIEEAAKRYDDVVDYYRQSLNALAKEISITDQLRDILAKDEFIDGYEFSEEQLRKILEYARFIKTQEE